MMISLVLLIAVQALTLSADESKNRPVTKVINLLKDMQTQLAKEGEEDEMTYEKLTCWCQANDKDKTTAVADAEARINDLTSTIEEETATSSRLTTEIKNLEQEIAKNSAALAKATVMRAKELAEFNAEEKDVLQSLGALKSAITVLGKHNSFIQVSDSNLVDTALMFHKHADMISEIATPEQKAVIASFIEGPNDFMNLLQGKKAGYAPQSGAIFGIMSQMKETFETNLANSQKEEQTSQSEFEQLKAAKEEEISTGESQRDTKTQELADSGANLAQAKQDKDDTENTLAADTEFLANLKETCGTIEQEYQERTSVRQEEIEACGEALSILSSEDAHDTFTKTFNFVQISKVETSSRKEQATTVLAEAGKKLNSPRLVALALSARNDVFAKLGEDIDGMVEGLKKEKADDAAQKDICIEEINNNERNTANKDRDIEESNAKIQQLKNNIADLTKAIEVLTAEVAEMQVQLKRAGEDREVENVDFQTIVADQRATQKLLTNALNVLKGFYDKKSLMQTSATQAPPTSFKKYEKKGAAGTGGVMGMIENIVNEAKAMEAEAIKAEADSQKAYETFVKDTNNALEEAAKSLTNKNANKADAEENLVATEEALAAQQSEQEKNQQENKDLHASCDFTLNNFEARQSALEQEMESLRTAKSVLSGSSQGFLQKN